MQLLILEKLLKKQKKKAYRDVEKSLLKKNQISRTVDARKNCAKKRFLGLLVVLEKNLKIDERWIVDS